MIRFSVERCPKMPASVLALAGVQALFSFAATAKPLVSYSIGEWTDVEQYALELVNRARSNPGDAAISISHSLDPDIQHSLKYFDVENAVMLKELASEPSLPPLAPSETLRNAAHRHSEDMDRHGFQGHVGSDGAGTRERIKRAGYAPLHWRENVFGHAASVEHAHAAMIVSWGTDAGGMQLGRQHRANVLSRESKEIGIGVVQSEGGGAGPVISTQVLATARTPWAFITGVVYSDRNGNGQYDLGEGVRGVKITAENTFYFAESAEAGGYAIPVPSDGSYPVTVFLPGQKRIETVTIQGGRNVKLDFPLEQLPPVIRGPKSALVGTAHAYRHSLIPGAQSYVLRKSRLSSEDWLEGAEEGQESRIIASTSDAYAVHRRGVFAKGSNAFHLTFADWMDQSIEIDRSILPSAHSELRFEVGFGWATTESTLYAEISTDEGSTWTEIWRKRGSGRDGRHQFSPQAVPLPDSRGLPMRVRFKFRHHNRAYIGTSPSLGVFLDDIHVTDSTFMVNSTTEVLRGDAGEFSFKPTEGSEFLLQLRANLPGQLPFGDPFRVVTYEASSRDAFRISSVKKERGKILIRCNHPGIDAQTLRLERTPALGDNWEIDSSATLQAGETDLTFEAEVPKEKSSWFYRVRSTPRG